MAVNNICEKRESLHAERGSQSCPSMNVPRLLELPDALLAEVLSCGMADWTEAAAVCHAFRSLVTRLRLACTAVNQSTLGLYAGANTAIGLNTVHSLRLLPNLCTLQLRKLPLSDEFVAAVAKSCPKLTTLDFSGCSKLSDFGISYLCQLNRLESLDVTYCGLVSYSSVVLLRDRFPNILEIRRQPAWLDGLFQTPWGE
ncbi:MAG: hypothetical protein SGPRY_011189, partial [Prymnesium sp.]